jgi:hypothetical protein
MGTCDGGVPLRSLRALRVGVTPGCPSSLRSDRWVGQGPTAPSVSLTRGQTPRRWQVRLNSRRTSGGVPGWGLRLTNRSTAPHPRVGVRLTSRTTFVRAPRGVRLTGPTTRQLAHRGVRLTSRKAPLLSPWDGFTLNSLTMPLPSPPGRGLGLTNRRPPLTALWQTRGGIRPFSLKPAPVPTPPIVPIPAFLRGVTP